MCAPVVAFRRSGPRTANRPDDTDLGPYNPDAPPVQQVRLPHIIAISRDGFVYVADRPNNRIQVFTKDGRHLRQGSIRLEANLAGGGGVGLRPVADPRQRFT